MSLQTPATVFWSPAFLLYLTYLNLSVGSFRVKTGIAIGNSRPKSSSSSSQGSDSLGENILMPSTNPAQSYAISYTNLSKKYKSQPELLSKITQENERKLLLANRALGNFTDNVPLVLGSLFLNELNGLNNSGWVHLGFVGLLIARISHVEFGLKGKDASAPGRMFGFWATTLIGLFSAGYNFSVGLNPFLDFVKSFL